jgi:hypothetical protein
VVKKGCEKMKTYCYSTTSLESALAAAKMLIEANSPFSYKTKMLRSNRTLFHEIRMKFASYEAASSMQDTLDNLAIHSGFAMSHRR